MAKKLLMGNEAFACAALEAGVGVVAGYPGTPSSELIETVAARVADGSARGVHVEWSTNEKAALELVAGASYAGARTLFTCKQVGLNVASDALMSLNYVGVEGGCVLYVADDPGPISSQTEQDTRRFASFAKVPVFDPENIEQGMDMMKAAFELSERYRTPVILRATTRVCHSSTFVEVADMTEARPAKGFVKDDSRWVIFPARAFRGHLEVNERLRWIEAEFSGIASDESLDLHGDVGRGIDVGVGVNPATHLWDDDLLPAVAKEVSECAAIPPASLGSFNPIEEGLDAQGGCSWRDFEDAVAAHQGMPVLGIVCGGVSAAYAREALAMIAQEEATQARAAQVGPLPYVFMQVGTPYPFPVARADYFADQVDRIIVFEELDHVIEDELVRLAGLRAVAGLSAPRVMGRRSNDCFAAGENTVEAIAERLRTQFDQIELEVCGFTGDALHDEVALRHHARVDERLARAQATPDVKLPARPPVLCAGCPHRGAFYAAKQAMRKMRARAVFSGDIGCYTLGNARPLDAVDTCLCMGAGITMAQGLSVAEPGVKQLAFVGDSTFFASGLTGVANAAYNGHDITVCVLDNSTTAMTGGQPHPGIGRTLMGTMSEPLSIEAALEALGVKCVEHANPHHLEEGIQAVTRAVEHEGVSAVIFRAPCVNLVKPEAPVTIDAQTCTGCKKCITSIGCPAIGFDTSEAAKASGARKRPGAAVIDPTLCTGCGLCTQVCPFGCIAKSESSKGAER